MSMFFWRIIKEMFYNSFKPGEEWRDTDNNLIQAHAGYIYQEDGTFYWYGENKEKSESERDCWHWGVRLYSSTDLYNWKDEGIILKAETSDTTHPLYFNSKMDRPHLIYNEKTKKYVMWIKIMRGPYSSTNHACIAVADSIKGPYQIVKDNYLPNGFEFGDFEIVKDGENAYLIYEKPHTELVISQLTEDYLAVEENYKSYFKNGRPPLIREAPATFVKDDNLYMVTSGTTAKFPNQSEIAVSNNGYMGEWKVLGDPFVGDEKKTSFDSQVSCIFKCPNKKNLYIVMADRWLIDLPTNLPNISEIYDEMFRIYPEEIDFREEDWTKRNTKNARYVWLPLVFENGQPVIKWYDEWKLEDFE